MGEYFNDLKFNAEVTSGKHESERSKALTAVQKYIFEARENLKRDILKLDNEDRTKWVDLLKEAEADVENYKGGHVCLSCGVSERHRTKSPDGFGLTELWKIAARGNEIYREMKANEKYGEIITEASTDNEISPASFDFIYEKYKKIIHRSSHTRRFTQASRNVRRHRDLHRDGQYRSTPLRRAPHHQQKTGCHGRHPVRSSARTFSIGQAEQLIDKAASAGLVTAEDKPALLAQLTEKQETTAEFEQSVEQGLQRKYRNQAQHLFEPKILGGLLLTVWRSEHARLVDRLSKRSTELLKSPYFYLDVAGIGAGLSLMQNKIF